MREKYQKYNSTQKFDQHQAKIHSTKTTFDSTDCYFRIRYVRVYNRRAYSSNLMTRKLKRNMYILMAFGSNFSFLSYLISSLFLNISNFSIWIFRNGYSLAEYRFPTKYTLLLLIQYISYKCAPIVAQRNDTAHTHRSYYTVYCVPGRGTRSFRC